MTCAKLENARLLNERINLNIPDYQLSHRYNTILHSSHSTTNSARNSTSSYSDNNAYNNNASILNGSISYDVQDMGFQNSS
ncbi:hypothetical protein RhiirC2_857695 [Rhizophagus irregularis]|uniref:Uncharacterized protein n=1 Tax=Rhizophagus irregularis TaxID=588596 RepID=A0A2N1MAG3_9GLOM|nr:hypothetical protein RhiirC2_857695 [Rhizophagus irregularis]